MARDGSGTYTRVSNSFTVPVAGTTISPTDADAFWDELEAEMTDSLSRSGKGGMTAALAIASNSASAIAIGRLGATTPAFQVDASTASQVAGIKVTGAATGGTVAVGVIDSGSNANLSIDAKGSGTISINGTGTGGVTIGRALTYGGVALTNAVTGTGKMVLDTSPTLVTPALGTPTSGVLTNATGLPLSGLVTQAAFTFAGNNTSGAAVPTAVDIAALTTKASPAAGDYIMISDQAASGAWKKSTVASVSTAGSVSSLNGATGALAFPLIPGGRLTLTSATPVTTTDVTAAGTVYYAPVNSIFVPIYNTADTRQYQFTSSATDAVGLSVTLGANWATNTLYDWFVINDSGTIRLASGPAWTSDTGRGTGAGTTELQMYNGLWTNKVSMTARYANASTTTVAANQGTYVGTFRTVAAGQAEDSLAKRFLYNAYNQASRVLQNALETTDNWNYTTAAFRQANANTANQLDIVVGLAGNGIDIDCLGISLSSVGNIFTSVGIGVDSTTVNSSQLMGPSTTTLTSRILTFAKYKGYPAIGRHYYPWLEFSTASGTTTWYGDNNNPTLSQSGLLGSILM